MFAPQVEALSHHYRLITPDLRCHGESEHRAEEHTQWDLMEDHVALLDRLRVDRAVWGGVRQGGFQSLRAALRHPERVAGLILIDTTAEPEDEIRAPMYEAAGQVAEEAGWSEETFQAALYAMFGESASDDLKRHWLSRWMAEPTSGALARMHAVTRREDLAIEMDEAERLAAGLPNLVEFVTIPGAGHSSTVEKPEPVTAAIERFLDKVLPS